ASFHHRFAMLNSCFRGLSGIEIDDIEAKRKGKSYTIDTIFTLREKYNRSSEYYLLIGADNLITIKEWKDWEKLLELVNFLVVPRQDIDLQSVDAAVKRKVTVLETPLYPYSSSEIRNNINDERYIKSALTADCLEYIHKNGLYGIK
ncbi:MAG: nicotinate (nicotinamide) nucleotide adenylyltransferase, partial [Candidatus Marinimicrobia bacterium]|nr:nicotinate (nicotinamide) nucleotide adenylyltransferase [Candidatus Neomarinimicrobiota bacterium]